MYGGLGSENIGRFTIVFFIFFYFVVEMSYIIIHVACSRSQRRDELRKYRLYFACINGVLCINFGLFPNSYPIEDISFFQGF